LEVKMEYKLVSGLYKRYPTKYYACFADGRLVVSTRKRDLPKVDEDFQLPARKNCKNACSIVAGCPKCQRAHVYPRNYSDFYLDAVGLAKDCGEYKMLVDLYQTYQTAGWLALDALKNGKKIGEIPKAMKRRLRRDKWAREATKRLLDLDILTDEARAELVSLLVGFWRRV
jgi:hypothetical protein